MPLLILLLGLLVPRLVLVGLWLLTDWFPALFHSLLWPVLGFVFVPTTLLWYGAVQHWFGGQWSLVPVVGMVIALALDVSPARRRRER